MKQAWFALLIFVFVSGVLGAQDYKSYDEGVAKYKAKEYKTVIESFTRLIGEAEKNKKIEEDLYFYRGQSYYHTGEYQNAHDDLDKCSTLGHYNKGTIYWYQARCKDKLGKKEDATRMYDQALKEAEKSRKLSAWRCSRSRSSSARAPS